MLILPGTTCSNSSTMTACRCCLFFNRKSSCILAHGSDTRVPSYKTVPAREKGVQSMAVNSPRTHLETAIGVLWKRIACSIEVSSPPASLAVECRIEGRVLLSHWVDMAFCWKAITCVSTVGVILFATLENDSDIHYEITYKNLVSTSYL